MYINKINSKIESHFYKDTETGKTHSVIPDLLHQVLVFSWSDDGHELIQKLYELEYEYPIVIVKINIFEIEGVLQKVVDGKVIACILLPCKSAIDKPSFKKVVEICTSEILLHKDFRLFVYPVGELNFLFFLNLASGKIENNVSVDLLVDSVHFANYEGNDINEAAKINLKEFIKDISKIRIKLKYDKFVRNWLKFLNIFWKSMFIQMILSSISLIIFGKMFVNTPWLPFICIIIGQIFYISVLALVSLPTRLSSWLLLRIMIAVIPIYIIKVFPMELLIQNWIFIAGGLLLSLIIDYIGRVVSNTSDINLLLKHKYEELSKIPSIIPGIRRISYFYKGPLFPVRTKVFISYSESSIWGSNVAKNLYHEFCKLKIDCFFAPASIEPGSSWRHRLEDEIYKSSIFILLLDEITAKKSWPEIELKVASVKQSSCALPAIIVVLDPKTNLESIIAYASEDFRTTVITSKHTERNLFRILEYKKETEYSIVESLKNLYRFDSVSLIPVWIAVFIDLPLNWIIWFLGILGTLGSILGSWGSLLIIGWMKINGISPIHWLIKERFLFPFFILSLFWIGYVARLIVASFKQIADENSKIAGGWRLIEFFLFVGYIYYLELHISKDIWLLGKDALMVGIIIGNFFINDSLFYNMKYT